jgi:ribosomal protein L18E
VFVCGVSSMAAVTVAAIWSPITTVRAELPSTARVSVNVSVLIVVTSAISAFVVVGWLPDGQMVTLNGAAGNFAPSAAATISDVPELAGDGAVATVE